MIAAIFAVDETGGMGREGTLPWPYDKEDLKWFKQHTTGGAVVMGSKAWDDPLVPKPLPNRTCIVATRRPDYHTAYPWADHWLDDINELPKLYELYREMQMPKTFWVAGGPTILMQARPYIQRAIVTYFHGDFNCDAKLDTNKFLEGFVLQQETFGRNKTFMVFDSGQLSRAA